jgi:2-oxoglutarate ferredoxin oxidoreductase subunit gamma
MQETKKELYEELIIAGFGGQGIMLAGKLLAQTAMNCGREVTYMPSYGAEVRGGTANCMIVIAENEIACPVVGKPDSLIVMNKASLNKFSPNLKKNGLLIFNSSLIDIEPQVDESIEVIRLPADGLAVELGSVKAANMVALGAYLQARGLFEIESAAQALPEILAKRHHNTLSLNINALQKGAEFVSELAIIS